MVALIVKVGLDHGNSDTNKDCRINLSQTTDIIVSADVTLLNLGYSNKMRIYLEDIAGSVSVILAEEDTLKLNQKIRIYRKYNNVPKGIYYPIFTLSSNTVLIENIKISTSSNIEYSPYNYGTFTIDFEGQTENYNYTFITKPLRSLPNGVRDSLEADGIHRKIGIQTGTLSQTTTITLSDAKQNGAYMCNIKSAGTLTGKTIELEAGDYEIIYELAEEIIEPYTEEQQEQYNKIKELYTFDGTTNISSDDEVPPYLQIQYYMKGE